uniref:Serine aminopeptidase S33 domain-containing protein n=1 Tax=Vitrella brassicaformis TaxID=1169539 RepID=A0A7S1K6R9_9ALVE|mmetsp:Transcript_40717/g.101798  ORF Transcript_40717/g.101798 Transcript_40717/m.101798 type:complete len:464 (+) Transcript_40717:144-1535(+)
MGNLILFPAPPGSYSTDLKGLIWIPKRHSGEGGGSDERFPALFIKSPTPTNHNLLYFHGNSCDLGHMREELEVLSHILGANVLAVEYPGYGLSSGSPSGDGIDDVARAGFDWLHEACNVPAKAIIVFGRSIGTGPACQLSRRLKEEGKGVGGLVLHSPYISIHAVVKDYAHVGTLLIGNLWDNEANLRRLSPDTPLCLLHGERDDVIPSYHSHRLNKGYNGELKMSKFSSTASHNEYDFYQDLLHPIQQFLRHYSHSRHELRRPVDVPPSCRQVQPQSRRRHSPRFPWQIGCRAAQAASSASSSGSSSSSSQSRRSNAASLPWNWEAPCSDTDTYDRQQAGECWSGGGLPKAAPSPPDLDQDTDTDDTAAAAAAPDPGAEDITSGPPPGDASPVPAPDGEASLWNPSPVKERGPREQGRHVRPRSCSRDASRRQSRVGGGRTQGLAAATNGAPPSQKSLYTAA